MDIADIICMIQIIQSERYKEWFKSIKDTSAVRIIKGRLERITLGNFGDHKSVGEGVWELRFRIGGGIRIYYTFDGKEVVLLLAGGNKATQKRDIKEAKQIAKEGSK